jgi:hypothetical protein
MYDNTISTPLSDVSVLLFDDDDRYWQTETDAHGNFAFNNIPENNYTINVVCHKPWGGVNSTDALLIERHFIGLTPLTGLRLLAADVNGSGTVNAADALLVAQRFTQVINSFPAGDWIFEDASFKLISDKMILVRGLCYGDVNGSYIPT